MPEIFAPISLRSSSWYEQKLRICPASAALGSAITGLNIKSKGQIPERSDCGI